MTVRGLGCSAATGIIAVWCLTQSASAQTLNYDIGRVDLSKALITLAVRSGRNIVFAPDMLVGKMSNPISGSHDFADALARLLAGTGLRAIVQADGSVVILRAPTLAPRPRALAKLQPASAPPASNASAFSRELPMVVVTGRSLSAFSLQRGQASSASLTGAEIEGEADHNIAEALGQLAGVTVLDGGASATNSVAVDFAGRGEGDYASLRGFDSEFNLSLIDGVAVAQSQPYSRGVQLNLLPTNGWTQLVVFKSLTANMDGDAVGGVLDFRTPTAYDFPSPSHVAMMLTGQVEDEALRYGRNPFGGGVALEASRLFGSMNTLGVYAAAYFDTEGYSNGIVDGIYPASSNATFAYRLETSTGASPPGLIPAENLVLTGLDVGVTTGQVQRYGGDISLDWRLGSHTTAYARLTLAVADTHQATYYDQIYGDQITTTPVGTSGLSTPLIGFVQPRYYYETNPEIAVLETLQLGGAKTFRRLTLSPKLFMSFGETNDPDHFELSGREPEVAPGLPFGGGALFATTDGAAPVPLLSAAQLQTVADIPDYGAHRAGELTREFSNQINYGTKLDGAYDLDSRDIIMFGAKYVDAYRNHTYRDYESERLYTTDADDPTLVSLGFLSGGVKQLVPGAFDIPAPTIDSGKAFAFFNANIQRYFGALANAIDTCSYTLYENNYNCNTQHGNESTASIYLMGRFKIGDLELDPGFRYEHTDVRSRFWVVPQTTGGSDLPGYFSGNHSTYDAPSPSLQANYRPAPLVLYRAAAWASSVRPAMFQLGGSSTVVNEGGGAAAGGATTITQGNPDLKAMQAANFDLSGDWADLYGGQADVALFYKRLRDYIFDTVGQTYANPVAVQTGDVIIRQPRNGGGGEVYGLELSGRQQFLALPAPANGLGVSANVTLEHSSVDTGMAGLNPHERLINQPNAETNVQLFYEKYGATVRLSYRYVSAYVSQYGTLGDSSSLDTWVRPATRLDLSTAYQTPFGVKVSVSVANLLDDFSYRATIGDRAWTIPSLVYSGRTFLLTLKVVL